MRRIQLFLFSAALLLSLFGMTAFTGISVASAHTHVANARATSAHVTRRSRPQVTCSGEGCDGQTLPRQAVRPMPIPCKRQSSATLSSNCAILPPVEPTGGG